MFGIVLSPMTSIMRGINKIENMKDKDCTTIDEYIKTVNIRYKSYKMKKYMKGFLRALLVVSGFAITTMTTYNNPYFDGESNYANIIVWYFSISNNIINLILEKVSAFDLDDEKNKIKLLIDEGLLYNDNKDNYALYPDSYEMKLKKLEYFKNTCEMIYEMDSYSFLTRDYDRPVHIKDINDRKVKKTSLLWRVPTPEDSKKNDGIEFNLPNSVPNPDEISSPEDEPEVQPEPESI
jgi:hypothetical protein